MVLWPSCSTWLSQCNQGADQGADQAAAYFPLPVSGCRPNSLSYWQPYRGLDDAYARVLILDSVPLTANFGQGMEWYNRNVKQHFRNLVREEVRIKTASICANGGGHCTLIFGPCRC